MRYMRKLHPDLDILVSSIGEVFVPATGNSKAHWTFGCNIGCGYRRVVLDGKGYLVHRLVAQTFLGEIPEGCQVDHVNRCPSDNRVENIRIVTPSQNSRNRVDHDRVEERGGTHSYDDKKQFNRELHARYRARHPEKVRGQKARYNEAKKKTHRRVRFADGTYHYVPHADAILLLAIPLKERHYHGK